MPDQVRHDGVAKKHFPTSNLYGSSCSMDQNHIAPSAFAPEAAADEPASPIHPSQAAAAADPIDPALSEAEGFEFATEAEANAYWAGVSDGLRNGGNIPAPRLAARARDAYPELVATADQLRDRDIIDFDPVSVRHRIDGWTPQKQREYVEALADSGVARYAAGRVGMSEQSANRLRRRADAGAFDRACDAAMRIGARRLISVAYERAIEGTIKRHYYHGEVRSEERVYDNRLLIALIGKLGPLIAAPTEPDPVAENWQPWMEAIEQGLPEPVPSEVEGPVPAAIDEPLPCALDPAPEPHAAAAPKADFNGSEVWEGDDGEWWTEFPPPPDFDGEEEGKWGDSRYQRTLSREEQAVIDADLAEEQAESLAEQSARRDLYFGFAGGDVFPPMGHEPSELYEASSPAEGMTIALPRERSGENSGLTADATCPPRDGSAPNRETREWPGSAE